MMDAFQEIARYYDRIMEHVNYERWFTITTELGALLPRDFRHLDAGCGTGTLIKRLRRTGWRSAGIDLSGAMIRAGRSGKQETFPAANADLRALPFSGSLDYITCLFDSVNFLVDEGDLERAFVSVSEALREGGFIYFDAVTERMVTQHFEGQEWSERNGKFTTTWSSSYCRRTGVVETRIRISQGAFGVVRERVFPEERIRAAVADAGLTLLGVYDAHTWKAPKAKTIRIDFVAAKNPGAALTRQFESIATRMRRLLS